MMIDTDRVIVDDRIRSDYGNIDELASDIKEQGLINPPLVTPDYHLIAGERRLLAMKRLGWPQIEVRIMNVTDALHQLKLEISENENRKDFSFSEKMKWAKMLKAEYEGIAKANSAANGFGSASGENSPLVENSTIGRVNEKVASEAGFGSKDTFRHALYIDEHADPEIIKQLDEGQLSINAAYRTLKDRADKLSDELQQKQNEYTTEAAKMAVKLEKQVKINADQEDIIATLKRRGDPDLIKRIDELVAQNRDNYELYRQTKNELDLARKRAELSEEKASKDRKKLDEATIENYNLLGQLEDLQDKLGDDADPPNPVVPFSGNPYTISILLREMESFSSLLDQFSGDLHTSTKDAEQFDEKLRDIVTKLGSLKKQMKEVA